MGIIYQAACPQCDYEGEFYLGGGRLGCNLFQSIRALNETEQKKVQKLDEEKQIIHFNVQKKLTICPHCHLPKQLKNRTIIEIMDKMNHLHIFGNICSDCGNEVEIYDETEEQMNKVVCPKCGKTSLLFRRSGHWD